MATIEVMKDAKGQFRFRVKAKNGEIIATGESYRQKAKALATIKALKSGAGSAKVIDLTAAKAPAAKSAKPAKKGPPAKAKAARKKAPAKAPAKKSASKPARSEPAAPAASPEAAAATATPNPSGTT